MSFPNQLSLLRLILSPVFLFLFISESVVSRQIALVLFIIAIFTDWYDGMHARKYGQISKTGIFLDPLADKFLTSAAFVAFYFMEIIPLWMVIVIVIRDIVMTLLRSYEELKGRTIKTSFAAKTKTFIQMAYIFGIVILVSAKTFTSDKSVADGIENFFHSPLNFYLALTVTLFTFVTGISYFIDLIKSPRKVLENN
jgi:CDP-diacylglycerol--glycerol-3-phosphate 3-phosphatidyltransferase